MRHSKSQLHHPWHSKGRVLSPRQGNHPAWPQRTALDLFLLQIVKEAANSAQCLRTGSRNRWFTAPWSRQAGRFLCPKQHTQVTHGWLLKIVASDSRRSRANWSKFTWQTVPKWSIVNNTGKFIGTFYWEFLLTSGWRSSQSSVRQMHGAGHPTLKTTSWRRRGGGWSIWWQRSR